MWQRIFDCRHGAEYANTKGLAHCVKAGAGKRANLQRFTGAVDQVVELPEPFEQSPYSGIVGQLDRVPLGSIAERSDSLAHVPATRGNHDDSRASSQCGPRRGEAYARGPSQQDDSLTLEIRGWGSH
jgi:hypothetical protein